MEETTKPQKMSVYFPPDLLEDTREAAKDEKRSFNQEVLWMVRTYLLQRKREVRREHKDV